MENIKNSLKSNWAILGRIILNPEALFLILTIGGLIALTYFSNLRNSPLILTIIIMVISLLSSLLGGFFMKKWGDLYKTRMLIARGYTTIRNINLLLSHIFSIKKRVSLYIRRLNREELNYDLLRSHFEEVAERCNNLFEDAVNTIENWQDVIPEANLKQQIAQVANIQKELNNRLDDLKDLRKLGDKMDKEMSETDRGKLKMTIDKVETTLYQLQEELKNEEHKVLIDKQFYAYEDGKLSFSDYNKVEKWEESKWEEKFKNLKSSANFVVNQDKEDIKLSKSK